MIPLLGLSFSALGKLLELAGLPRLSADQRGEAVSLTRELRGLGFTNRNVEVLVGGRWKEATIKKYTRGVKVVSTEERDLVLKTFSSFVAAGKTLQDVEEYLAISGLLESHLMKLETVIEFISGLLTQRIELAKLVDLYYEVEGQDYTVAEIISDMDTLRSLKEEGISREEIREFDRITGVYGGLEGIIKAMSAYNGLRDLQAAQKIAEKMLSDSQSDIKEIESEIQVTHARALAIQTYYNVAQSLVSNYSFLPQGV